MASFRPKLTENKRVANLTRLFEAAKSSDMTVAVSPHYEATAAPPYGPNIQ